MPIAVTDVYSHVFWCCWIPNKFENFCSSISISEASFQVYWKAKGEKKIEIVANVAGKYQRYKSKMNINSIDTVSFNDLLSGFGVVLLLNS